MIRNKWKQKHGGVQLAGFEVYFDTKMGNGFWEGISTHVMARGDFEREKITPNAIGLFKKIFKNFPK